MPIPHSEQSSAKTSKKVDIHSPLLEVVLFAFIQLIPHHPSVFRPFVGQLRSLLSGLLAPTPLSHIDEDQDVNEICCPLSSTVALAQQLFSLLYHCAPKNAFSEDWSNTVRVVLVHFHRTADYVFRAVDEDWISLNKRTSSVDSRKYGDDVGDHVDDTLGLPSWQGIFAGIERLSGLLQLLQAHLAIASNASITIPIGSFLSLIERTLSILPPMKSQSAHEMPIRLNPEIGRDEREGLWSGLPQIHGSAIELLSVLISRLGTNSLPFLQSALEQLLWIFRHTQPDHEVRRRIYNVVTQIINLCGPSLPRKAVSSMSGLIRACCADILHSSDQTERGLHPVTNGPSNLPKKPTAADNADSYLQSKDKAESTSATPTSLYNAASAFLPVVLGRIPSDQLTFALRAQIDRTAIFAKQKETLLASVLNPPIQAKQKNISSIMPFIAREHADKLEVEAVIRPRMPLLQQQENSNGGFDDEDEGVYVRDNQADAGTVDQRSNKEPEEPSSSQPALSFPEFGGRTTSAQGMETQGFHSPRPLPTDNMKRPREPEPEPASSTADPLVPDIQPGHPHVEEATQSVKRVRFDQDVYSVPKGPTSQSHEPVMTDSPASMLDAALNEAVARATGAAKDRRRRELGNDSEESDGDEIPPIDPTLATDSEDEDDEDEDEDEEDEEDEEMAS